MSTHNRPERVAQMVQELLGERFARGMRDPRIAGQKLMLYGLLWLIVYDVCFVAGYIGMVAAGLLLLFAPAAYCSVQLMRWWGNILSLSQRPAFQRAR